MSSIIILTTYLLPMSLKVQHSEASQAHLKTIAAHINV